MLWSSFSTILSLRPSRMALFVSALLLHPFGSAHALPVPDSIMVREGARAIWDFESSSEGWGPPNMITGLAACNGCLRGTAIGGDPYIVGPLLDDKIEGSSAAGLVVRIYLSAPGSLELFWENEDGVFSSVRRVVQTVPGQQWTTVRFDLSSNPQWANKTIRRLRLDPGTEGTSFDIDYVAAVDQLQTPDATWLVKANNFDTSLDGWTASSQVGNLLSEEGKLKGITTGNDPCIMLSDISLAGQAGVMAQFKATAGCPVTLYWATTEGGFSEIRSKSVTYHQSGGWQLLKFDLRDNPQWAGKTITRLRLDPGYVANVSFEFDSILITESGGFEDADGDLIDSISELVIGTDPKQPNQSNGKLLYERWNNTNFYSTGELVGNSRFYSKPDLARLDRLDASSPFYKVNHFATRARGWLTAPETGTYRFWISGTSGVQLQLSQDGTKYTKRVIAELNPDIGTGNGVPQQSTNLWDNYGSQMSKDIQLTAGQSYHLEAIQTTGHVGNAHASIAWARPGKARTPLQFAYLRSYMITPDDLDDDYLPDAFEQHYGLDIHENGYNAPDREGERGDFDSDGLSNREEYLLGTDPSNSDTDGDGVSDYDEVYSFKTMPTQSNSLTGQEVPAPALASYNAANTTASWQILDGGLMSDSFRGKIEWSFTVPSDGWWVIDLSARLRGTLRNSEEVDLGLRIDGKALAPQKARFLSSGVASVKVITPFLTAGMHTFELDIRNEIGRRSLQILSLKILGAGGYDGDRNGRPDWLDAILAGGNSVLPVPAQSWVSPLFIEGSTRHLGAVGARAAGQDVTVLRGLGDLHWCANVPLQAASPTSLDVVFENKTQSQSIEWTRWNALGGAALTIRRGDSVKIGAWLSPQDSAAVTIAIGGQTQSLAANGFIVKTFAQAGVYPISVTHSGAAKTAATITVLDADFGVVPVFYAASPIWRSFPQVPLSLLIGGEPSLTVESKTAAGTGQKVLLRADRAGSHTIAARLPESGAIVALAEFSTVGFSDALRHDATMYVGSTAEGFRILRTPVLVTDLPPGGRVVMTIFRAGVTFMDGTTVMNLNAEDFSNGVAYVDFRYPANMSGGYCHYTDIYDADGRYLGRR